MKKLLCKIMRETPGYETPNIFYQVYDGFDVVASGRIVTGKQIGRAHV